MNAQHTSPTQNETVEYNPGMALFWLLLIAGLALVLFAEALADALAMKQGYSTPYVDREAASRYLVKIYIVAGISIFLSVAERIALEIRALRRG